MLWSLRNWKLEGKKDLLRVPLWAHLQTMPPSQESSRKHIVLFNTQRCKLSRDPGLVYGMSQIGVPVRIHLTLHSELKDVN